MLLLLPSIALAQANHPATAPVSAVGSNEPDLVRRHVSVAPTASSTENSSASDPMNVLKVALALALVLAIIFFLRWIMRRMLPGNSTARSTRAIQVLSRSVVSPKQQLLLVQVGRRLVVVANSGGQMSSLCQITDPEEITELVGRIREEQSDTLTRSFGTLFRRAEKKFDPDEPPLKSAASSDVENDTTLAPAIETRSEGLGDLADKVRQMKQKFRD